MKLGTCHCESSDLVVLLYFFLPLPHFCYICECLYFSGHESRHKHQQPYNGLLNLSIPLDITACTIKTKSYLVNHDQCLSFCWWLQNVRHSDLGGESREVPESAQWARQATEGCEGGLPSSWCALLQSSLPHWLQQWLRWLLWQCERLLQTALSMLAATVTWVAAWTVWMWISV